VLCLDSERGEFMDEQAFSFLGDLTPLVSVAVSNSLKHQMVKTESNTDSLTGLNNHRGFMEKFLPTLEMALKEHVPLALLMMDLDGFKSVNDRYGHKNGDALLVEVGRVLRAQLRKSDICLRYGGDEFVAILPGVDKALADQTARRIQLAFENRGLINIEGEGVGVGISVGVATFPMDGIDADTLLVAADRDMYLNKSQRSRRLRPEGLILPFEKKGEQRT